jgi:hypothetical protein
MKYALILTAMLMMGCGVKEPIYGRQDPYSPGQVNFVSEDLRTHTAVMPPVPSRDPAGLLHVTLAIRAATDRQLYVDYRARFFDREGQLITETGWISKVLAPNVPDQIVVNSITPRASDFQIDLRYTRIN